MFYVLAVVVVMVLDLWFLGDVQMNEVWIVRFLGGKVGILGGNLGYLIQPKSGSYPHFHRGFDFEFFFKSNPRNFHRNSL